MHIDVALKGILVSVVHGVRGTADLQLSGSMVFDSRSFTVDRRSHRRLLSPPDWCGSNRRFFGIVAEESKVGSKIGNLNIIHRVGCGWGAKLTRSASH
jgi:hypothetical protein